MTLGYLRTGLTVLVLAVLPLMMAPARAQEQDAPAVLHRVQSAYDSIDALRASFTQTTLSAFSDDTTTFSGTLLLKENKFRVEAAQQTLVTNGETTWIYTPSENQVIVNDYVNDETTLTPDEVFYDYADRFDVTSMEAENRSGERYYVLELVPKEEGAFYQDVTIHVRDRDAMITRLRLHDQNGSIVTFELDDITLNPPLTAEDFTFTPPSNAEVVDLRS